MYTNSHIISEKWNIVDHTGNISPHEGSEDRYSIEDTHIEKTEHYFAASHDPDHLHKYPVHEGEEKVYFEI